MGYHNKKTGARHSAQDQGHLNDALDHLVQAGAEAKPPDGTKSFSETSANATSDGSEAGPDEMACSKCDYTGKAKMQDGNPVCPDCGADMKMPDGTKTFDSAMQVAFGDSLKTLGPAVDHLVPVGGYLIRYGDPSKPDLQGDYFTPDTDFGSATKSDMWLHHTLPLEFTDTDGTIKAARVTKRFSPGELTKDQIGVFLKSMLDERDEYEQMVLGMAKAGKLGLSSGVPDHLIERDAKTNGTSEIKRWILGSDASYDHTPAEWRGGVMPIGNVKTFRVEALPRDEALQGMRAESEVKTNIAKTNDTVTEATVTEEEKKALNDKIAAQELTINQQAGSLKTLGEQVATITAALEKEKPKASGVQVEPDQKHPYKSFRKDKKGRIIDGVGYAEFLLDVREASQPIPHVSERLARVMDAGLKSFKAATGLTTQIPSAGGFFVQTDHSSELVKNMFEQGDLLSLINKVPLGPGADGVTLNGVDESSRVTTLWGGILPYWLAEADTISPTKPKFREIKLEVKGLAAAYYATDKIMKVAPALGVDVSNGFRGAMTYFVEEALIQGTGAGKPLGLMAASLIASGGSTISVTKDTNQAATTVSFSNIVNMWARLFPESKKNAVWLCNVDVTPQLNAMYMATGIAGIAPRFIDYGADGVLRMLGRPVIETEHCLTLGAQGDLVLWDPTSYRFADLGDVEEATSIHVEFLTAQNVFRYLYYCDGQPQLARSLTPRHGSNTLSTQVVLDART